MKERVRLADHSIIKRWTDKEAWVRGCGQLEKDTVNSGRGVRRRQRRFQNERGGQSERKRAESRTAVQPVSCSLCNLFWCLPPFSGNLASLCPPLANTYSSTFLLSAVLDRLSATSCLLLPCHPLSFSFLDFSDASSAISSYSFPFASPWHCDVVLYPSLAIRSCQAPWV